MTDIELRNFHREFAGPLKELSEAQRRPRLLEGLGWTNVLVIVVVGYYLIYAGRNTDMWVLCLAPLVVLAYLALKPTKSFRGLFFTHVFCPYMSSRLTKRLPGARAIEGSAVGPHADRLGLRVVGGEALAAFAVPFRDREAELFLVKIDPKTDDPHVPGFIWALRESRWPEASRCRAKAYVAAWRGLLVALAAIGAALWWAMHTLVPIEHREELSFVMPWFFWMSIAAVFFASLVPWYFNRSGDEALASAIGHVKVEELRRFIAKLEATDKALRFERAEQRGGCFYLHVKFTGDFEPPTWSSLYGRRLLARLDATVETIAEQHELLSSFGGR